MIADLGHTTRIHLLEVGDIGYVNTGDIWRDLRGRYWIHDRTTVRDWRRHESDWLIERRIREYVASTFIPQDVERRLVLKANSDHTPIVAQVTYPTWSDDR